MRFGEHKGSIRKEWVFQVNSEVDDDVIKDIIESKRAAASGRWEGVWREGSGW